MRIAILVIFAFLGAVASTHEDAAETTFLEAQTSISMMQKKGATDADCKDLAKTMCKEISSEVRKDQSVIDKQSSGIECTKLGQKAVDKATREYTTRTTQWATSKKAITTAANTRVTITSQSFSSLREGKCGFVWSSRSYTTAARKHREAVKYETVCKGKVVEAKKAVENTKAAQKEEQEKCRCAVVKQRDTTWKTLSSRSKRTRQVKAYHKCHMMQCVLAGTSLTSRKCKGTLATLRNKTLHSITEHAHSTGICARRHAKQVKENNSKERSKKKAAAEAAAKKKEKDKKKAAEAAAKKKEKDKKKAAEAAAKKKEKDKKEKRRKAALKEKERAKKSQERSAKSQQRERASKRRERASKELLSKRESSSKAQERRNKAYCNCHHNGRRNWAGVRYVTSGVSCSNYNNNKGGCSGRRNTWNEQYCTC